MLLDVDGTLVDSNDAHASAWQEAFSEAGYDIPFERIRPLIGMGGDKLLIAIDPSLRKDELPGKEITKRRQVIFLQKYAPTLRPTRGARALVEHLRQHHVQLTIASSAEENELNLLLERAGVRDLIEEKVTATEVKESKPAPDIVLTALKKSEASPQEAFMLGDTRYDIESAAKAGIPAIALRCGGSDEQELTGAYAVYDDPEDLLLHGLETLLR